MQNLDTQGRTHGLADMDRTLGTHLRVPDVPTMFLDREPTRREIALSGYLKEPTRCTSLQLRRVGHEQLHDGHARHHRFRRVQREHPAGPVLEQAVAAADDEAAAAAAAAVAAAAAAAAATVKAVWGAHRHRMLGVATGYTASKITNYWILSSIPMRVSHSNETCSLPTRSKARAMCGHVGKSKEG